MEGPRLLVRLVDEVHASQVGEMTPTQARCAAMLLDRFAPTMSAVHHTVEGQLAKMTEAELLAEIARVTTPALAAPQETDDDETDAPIQAKAPEPVESAPADEAKQAKPSTRKARRCAP